MNQKMHDAIVAVIGVHGADPEKCAAALEALLAGSTPPWQEASAEEVASAVMDGPMINIGDPRCYAAGETLTNNPSRAHIEACRYTIADTIRRRFLVLALPTTPGPRIAADFDELARQLGRSGTIPDGTSLVGLTLFLLRTYSLVPRG